MEINGCSDNIIAMRLNSPISTTKITARNQIKTLKTNITARPASGYP